MPQSYENNAKPCYNIISTQRSLIHVDQTQLNNTSAFTDSDTGELRRATDIAHVMCVTRNYTRDLYTGSLGHADAKKYKQQQRNSISYYSDDHYNVI